MARKMTKILAILGFLILGINPGWRSAPKMKPILVPTPTTASVGVWPSVSPCDPNLGEMPCIIELPENPKVKPTGIVLPTQPASVDPIHWEPVYPPILIPIEPPLEVE